MDDGTRRSKRTKIQPVAFWKNEKVVYARRVSSIGQVPTMIQDVIRINSDDELPIKMSKPKTKKVKQEFEKEIKDSLVFNYETQKEQLSSNT
jgi:hypothetical protein